MEEPIWSLIFHGCKLARDLELNLPNLVNQPDNLSKCFDEIVSVFTNVKDQFNVQLATTSSVFQEPEERQQWEMAEGMQEWLRQQASFTQAMDLFQAQFLAENVHGIMDSGIEFQVQTMDHVSDNSVKGSSSSSQRQRRKKDNAENHTVIMPAPRVGNTEIPPEDGYTWRKYGQKEILGSKFPRSYYRCTHQKLYNCPAKKQVQRLDDDPYTFEVTYRSNHTCIMSLTSPISMPPTSMEVITTREMTQQFTAAMQPPLLPPSTSVPLSKWLSMDINTVGSEGFSTLIDMEMYSGSSMVGNSGAGPSTVHYRREVDQYQPVTDLADAMFNSGTSSNNSMELIFSTMEENNEGGNEKK